jgi:hypothetical protein
VPRSDAASARMHLFVCEYKVSTAAVQIALSRSALLRDMHRDDPEGCVHMPCDTGTWTAWLEDDPTQMTADAMELMLAVIKVRVLCTQELWMLACCQLKYARPRDRSVGCNRRYAAKLLYHANVNAHGFFFQIAETAAGFSRNKNNSIIAHHALQMLRSLITTAPRVATVIALVKSANV